MAPSGANAYDSAAGIPQVARNSTNFVLANMVGAPLTIGDTSYFPVLTRFQKLCGLTLLNLTQ